MATSKTLTPTNVTIQIPAFADKPDQRLNSNCLDKEADAINALSGQIGKVGNPISITDVSVSVDSQNTGETVVQNFTLDKGTYLIFTTVVFAANATGARFVSVNYQNVINTQWFDTRPASPMGSTALTYCRPIYANADNYPVYVVVRQNSGSALTVSVHTIAVQLA